MSSKTVIYVYAAPPPGQFLSNSRLYAYPRSPEMPPPAGGFLILDSGAFALSLRGRRIGPAHMLALSVYYKRHVATDQMPMLAIAPDTYLDPKTSMQNMAWWQERELGRVVPVIQFSKLKRLDWYSVYQQVEFYRQYAPEAVAISNPGLRGIQASEQGMGGIIELVRDGLESVKWLHILGAGWDSEDLRAWASLCPGPDSVDSIVRHQPGH